MASPPEHGSKTTSGTSQGGAVCVSSLNTGRGVRFAPEPTSTAPPHLSKSRLLIRRPYFLFLSIAALLRSIARHLPRDVIAAAIRSRSDTRYNARERQKQQKPDARVWGLCAQRASKENRSTLEPLISRQSVPTRSFTTLQRPHLISICLPGRSACCSIFSSRRPQPRQRTSIQ